MRITNFLARNCGEILQGFKTYLNVKKLTKNLKNNITYNVFLRLNTMQRYIKLKKVQKQLKQREIRECTPLNAVKNLDWNLECWTWKYQRGLP